MNEELKRNIMHRMIDGARYFYDDVQITMDEDGIKFTHIKGKILSIGDTEKLWEDCKEWIETESPVGPPYCMVMPMQPPKTWVEMAYRQIVAKEPWVWDNKHSVERSWETSVAFAENEIVDDSIILGLIQQDGTVKIVERLITTGK